MRTQEELCEALEILREQGKKCGLEIRKKTSAKIGPPSS